MSPTPYRYAEKSVYRYVGVILTIQDNPMVHRIEFDPKPIGVNAETAACRLRDAIHSLSTGLTTHPSINPTLLKERFRHYRVSHDGTKVFVVPKTEKKNDSPNQLSIDQASSDVLARVESTETGILSAFALLLGRQYLQGRVEIVGLIEGLFVAKLEKEHDITMIHQDELNHIMF